MVDVAEIERRVDRAIAAPIAVNADIGGIALENMGQVMEFAKLMAVSGSAVPGYLRGNPGGCLAICSRALRWQMDPFAVAEKSYQVTNKGEERIAFEAQLVHAVITARAPLKTRLRYEIIGEGDERRCKVWGTFRGEDTPHSYTSEPLGRQLANRPKRRDGDGFGGSPLWVSNPEVQMAYSAVRQWCRLHASEVLLGVYTPDELDDGSEKAVDVPLNKVAMLSQRLKDATAKHATKGRGLDVEHVKRETSGHTVIEGEANPGPANDEVKNGDQHESTVGGRGADDQGGGRHPDDAVGSSNVVNEASRVGKADARSQEATVKGKGEVSPDDTARAKGKSKRE